MTKLIQILFGITPSKKNVKCYKVLKHFKYGGLFTPQRHVPITTDIISGDKLFEAEGEIEKINNIVRKGMIHTYQTKKSAEEYINYQIDRMYGNSVSFELYECIIPKNTSMCKYNKNYASKKIKFCKLINKYYITNK